MFGPRNETYYLNVCRPTLLDCGGNATGSCLLDAAGNYRSMGLVPGRFTNEEDLKTHCHLIYEEEDDYCRTSFGSPKTTDIMFECQPAGIGNPFLFISYGDCYKLFVRQFNSDIDI